MVTHSCEVDGTVSSNTDKEHIKTALHTEASGMVVKALPRERSSPKLRADLLKGQCGSGVLTGMAFELSGQQMPLAQTSVANITQASPFVKSRRSCKQAHVCYLLGLLAKAPASPFLN